MLKTMPKYTLAGAVAVALLGAASIVGAAETRAPANCDGCWAIVKANGDLERERGEERQTL